MDPGMDNIDDDDCYGDNGGKDNIDDAGMDPGMDNIDDDDCYGDNDDGRDKVTKHGSDLVKKLYRQDK